jgi:glycosyltransferase involved in cell wall biosynthesis
MRILVVSNVTMSMRGGVPVETARLIRGLRARGHHLAFMGDMPIEGTESVQHFPLSLPIDRKLSPRLREVVTAFKPDLIHVMAMSSLGIAQIAPLLRSVPWVFTCHSVSPYERKLQYLHWNDTAHYAARSLRFAANTCAWKWLFRKGFISHAIVHSHWLEDVVRRYGQPMNRVSLIPLGYEATENVNCSSHVPKSEGPLRLLTIGGIAHTKGYHDALVALAELRRIFPKIEYMIIGETRDPSYARFLETMIRKLGLRGSVQIFVNASDADKEEALRRADVYLQPSHEEGFCLAYIEAASVVPLLVGADAGAIRLISANDVGARVVPVRQPSRIADAVRELSTISRRSDLLLQRQARLLSGFSWSKYIDTHESLYAHLRQNDKAPLSPRSLVPEQMHIDISLPHNV